MSVPRYPRKSIPGYKSIWNGREIDEALTKLMNQLESAFVIIDSTEATPYNIDELKEIGEYSIEYVTPSVLPTPILEKNERPIHVINTIIDGILTQAITTPSDTYIRTYENEKWEKWVHYSRDVPEDIVCSIDAPDFPEIDPPIKPVDAEFVMIHKTDGTEVSLQDYYEEGLLPGGNPDNPGNENDNPVSQTTPVQWRADKVTILHRGVPYSLSDIMDKILSLG